ncbi:hypothetical protein F6455_08545 [Proteobacteria bacterium 005FR1]|nr:hypothetical protein [Proteobacteria bacterium 005FR1]
MLNGLQKLSTGSTLWLLFSASVVILLAIRYAAASWGLELLDEIYRPDQVREALREMSQEQKLAHVWISASLDLIFPLVLGGLLGGLTIKLLPSCVRYLLIPVATAVLVDLWENTLQIVVLLELKNVVEAKAIATAVKMAAYLVALTIVMLGACKSLVAKWTGPEH